MISRLPGSVLGDVRVWCFGLRNEGGFRSEGGSRNESGLRNEGGLGNEGSRTLEGVGSRALNLRPVKTWSALHPPPWFAAQLQA